MREEGEGEGEGVKNGEGRERREVSKHLYPFYS